MKTLMKKLLFIFSFLCFSFTGSAQELKNAEGFFIGSREIRPSLSFLAPEIPSKGRTLPPIEWVKSEKREVNLVEMMEKRRYEIQSSYVELDSPLPNVGKTEKTLIQFSNDLRFHDRGSNYDIYTGKKLIPAYDEMKVRMFNGVYSPYTGRSYLSPYSY